MTGGYVARVILITIITASIFIYDLVTPHGMSVSLLYLIPFTLSGLFATRKFALAFSAVTTALVIAGYFLASATQYPVYSEIHRALTILWGWGILAGLMQRKRVLSELSEANARLRAIFDSSPNGIIVLDPEGKVLDWNRGAQEIFGYAAEEVKGRPYPLAPEDDYHTFKKDLDSALSGNTVQNIELSRKCKDGRMIHILHSHAPLRDAEGNIYGALGIFIDMTSMKQAEAEIEKLNIDIATRKGVEQEREDLAAMITHDLKSPLTAMMAYTDMLIENRIEDKKEALNIIRQGSEKILGMVEDYLTVYRSHARKLELQTNLEEVVDILRGLEKDFHALAEKKDLRLNFVFADSPKAFIDKKQFSRAVSNLVENAVKFTPRGGSITLSVEASDSDFTVSVSDTGPGILPEEQENIFQKHYRSRMAMGTKGAGLGLAIVKAIAEAHGGKITFENNPGSGSTFKLTIPMRPGNAA
jgi:PAS domain S-box-containing protein